MSNFCLSFVSEISRNRYNRRPAVVEERASMQSTAGAAALVAAEMVGPARRAGRTNWESRHPGGVLGRLARCRMPFTRYVTYSDM